MDGPLRRPADQRQGEGTRRSRAGNGAKGFGYFGPIKVTRRGAKSRPESNPSPPDTTEPLCDAERHELHSDAERRHDNQNLSHCKRIAFQPRWHRRRRLRRK
ncbi:hypothetical protein F4W67_07030 [Pseudomonas caricapapayae]|nr:hypothetical protein F4W67_07030 [Pseudomonas caricapapayae]